VSCERRIQAGHKKVVKVTVKFIEGEGKALHKSGGPQLGGLEVLISVLKGLYKLKVQMAGKIWTVFAGWGRWSTGRSCPTTWGALHMHLS
jgi:hypothetical protein